ncbi:MAG: hypothetical protein ACLFTE_07690 [Salinivenus sp.]
MVDTLEVRWFIDGPPPPDVTNWIQALGATPESTRTDLYLVSEDPAMNVKLREGQVETKHRIGDRHHIQFGDTHTGVQERWVKWSFPTVEQHHDLFDDDPTGLWVPVHKERLQRSILPHEQSDLLDHLIESNPATAEIELTTVRSGGHQAWTICVEASGDPKALPGTVQQIGNHLFSQGTPPSLSSNHSFGYARWIQSLNSSSPERQENTSSV